MHGAAWSILLHAVQGKELLPAHARGYATRALAKSRASMNLLGASMNLPVANFKAPPPKALSGITLRALL